MVGYLIWYLGGTSADRSSISLSTASSIPLNAGVELIQPPVSPGDTWLIMLQIGGRASRMARVQGYDGRWIEAAGVDSDS